MPSAPPDPLSNHHADDRRLEARHFEHILRNDLRLTALFGADAGIRARRVDEADDRQAVLGCELHLGERLAIAFRMSTPEEAGIALFERFAFLVTDHHDFILVELGETCPHGAIVAEELIAVQLDEFIEDEVEIVGGHWPVGMPRDLHGLPGCQVAVDFLLQLGQLAAQLSNLVVLRQAVVWSGFKFLQAHFELVNRALKSHAVVCGSHQSIEVGSKVLA